MSQMLFSLPDLRGTESRLGAAGAPRLLAAWLGSLSQDATSSWLAAAEIRYSGQRKGCVGSCSGREMQRVTALAQLLQCLSADGCDVVAVSALCPAFSRVPTVIWKQKG